jgi:predicted GIY-YIG superfamily endonuclease
MWRVYVLALRDINGVYIGKTNDFLRRYVQHEMGQGAVITKTYRVSHIVTMIPCYNELEATCLERNMTITYAVNGHLAWGSGWTSLEEPCRRWRALSDLNFIKRGT